MSLSRKLAPLWALAEKVAAQYVQAFIVALLASSFFNSLDWSLATSAAVATIPAAITVLVNATTGASIPTTWPYLVQVLMRTLRSGASAFGGYLLAVPVFTLDLSLGKAAWGAAGVAMLGVIKAELGRFVGNPDTVAWLPKAVDPGTAQEVDGYSPNDNDPDGPKEPGEVPAWAGVDAPAPPW